MARSATSRLAGSPTAALPCSFSRMRLQHSLAGDFTHLLFRRFNMQAGLVQLSQEIAMGEDFLQFIQPEHALCVEHAAYRQPQQTAFQIRSRRHILNQAFQMVPRAQLMLLIIPDVMSHLNGFDARRLTGHWDGDVQNFATPRIGKLLTANAAVRDPAGLAIW